MTIYTHLYQLQHSTLPQLQVFRTAQSPSELGDLGGETSHNRQTEN
jgi:hypothetical protein